MIMVLNDFCFYSFQMIEVFDTFTLEKTRDFTSQEGVLCCGLCNDNLMITKPTSNGGRGFRKLELIDLREKGGATTLVDVKYEGITAQTFDANKVVCHLLGSPWDTSSTNIELIDFRVPGRRTAVCKSPPKYDIGSRATILNANCYIFEELHRVLRPKMIDLRMSCEDNIAKMSPYSYCNIEVVNLKKPIAMHKQYLLHAALNSIHVMKF